eukprot:1543718-Amphidinium_carterae.2
MLDQPATPRDNASTHDVITTLRLPSALYTIHTVSQLWLGPTCDSQQKLGSATLPTLLGLGSGITASGIPHGAFTMPSTV